MSQRQNKFLVQMLGLAFVCALMLMSLRTKSVEADKPTSKVKITCVPFVVPGDDGHVLRLRFYNRSEMAIRIPWVDGWGPVLVGIGFSRDGKTLSTGQPWPEIMTDDRLLRTIEPGDFLQLDLDVQDRLGKLEAGDYQLIAQGHIQEKDTGERVEINELVMFFRVD